jgi:phosphoserine aminotransferase
MPSREEVSYFGAGPAGLPSDVLEIAAKALIDYENTGLGIAEHSHRSELAANIINSTKVGLATYLDIPSDYDILFMQGGGTGEFSATLLNFVGFWVAKKRQALLESGKDEEAIVEELQKAVKDLKVDYLITGSWSLKASQEAVRLLGAEHVNIVADAREENGGKFGVIPEESTWKLSKAPAMVYYCDNETVDGVEFPGFPKSLERTTGSEDEPIVVADMSSNILSRRIAVKNFSLIFFGAQKNLGTTGITVVIIKRSLLPPALATPPPSLMRKLGLPIGPIVFDFAAAARSNSLYNTLSIFDVYIAGLVLKRLLNIFPDKVDGQQAVSNRKADIIYAVLDSNPQIYKV